jgi:hypothetical protein
VLVVGGLIWLVLWSQRSEPVAEQVNDFETNRSDWESAMRKVGVEADFPSGPVDVEEIEASGEQAFSATLTEREVSALLVVYRYRSDEFADRLGLERVDVSFPEPNRVVLEGQVLVNGERFQARAEAPVTFAAGRIMINRPEARLTVEGFPVGGSRREEAMEAISEYLNAMLTATPGLEVESAEVLEGSVRVEGTAPTRIEHPEPLPPAGPGAVPVLSAGS